mgnify:CR=1 FL=1
MSKTLEGAYPEKGIAVSAQLNSVFISTLYSLQRIDLATDQLLWERAYEGGCDRMSISPDGKTAAVMVTIHFPPGPKHEFVPEVVEFSQALEDELGAKYPDLVVARTGLVLFDHAMLVTMEEDMALLMPVMLGLIVLLTADRKSTR